MMTPLSEPSAGRIRLVLGGGDNFFFVGEVVVLPLISAKAGVQDQKNPIRLSRV
jgi:hypothetical protein